MKGWWRQGAALLVGSGLMALAIGFPTWSFVKRQIHREFGDVSQISTPALAQQMTDRKRQSPLLLDVREDREFAVSHIVGAVRVSPDADATTIRVAKETPIVTYCSVGYRSAKFAQRLQRAGFTDVRNLDGSIFQWANEDRPLVSGGRPAEKVHPYNRVWGSLLKAERRAPL